MNDSDYMQYALQLAARGRHTARPNPMVGAVVVQDGRIVGKGWHQQAGGPHAEVMALKEAGACAKGATLYVTLEPCSHVGKTPPCADLVIRCGIRRVVCAMQDPFARVNGRGIARLREAGITVDIGTEREAAEILNRGYLQTVRKGRPYIVAKWAMTLDGKTATAGGESQWITSEEARADAHRWRAAADAVAVGIGTILTDNPRLTVRYGDTSWQPLCAVWDTHARIPLNCTLLTERPNDTVVLIGEESSREAAERIRRTGATVISLPLSPDGHIDTEKALQALTSLCAVHELFVEGGATLLGALSDGDYLDEITTYIAPKAFGGVEAKGAMAGQGIRHITDAHQYVVADIRRCGPDVRITYTRHRKEEPCLPD